MTGMGYLAPGKEALATVRNYREAVVSDKWSRINQAYVRIAHPRHEAFMTKVR
jgi:hypothetical protein